MSPPGHPLAQQDRLATKLSAPDVPAQQCLFLPQPRTVRQTVLASSQLLSFSHSLQLLWSCCATLSSFFSISHPSCCFAEEQDGSICFCSTQWWLWCLRVLPDRENNLLSLCLANIIGWLRRLMTLDLADPGRSTPAWSPIEENMVGNSSWEQSRLLYCSQLWLFLHHLHSGPIISSLCLRLMNSRWPFPYS